MKARKDALNAAFDEFDHVCRDSIDCRDYEKVIEPMRTECIRGKDQIYTCYRAMDFTITNTKKEKSFKDSEKKDEVVSAIVKNGDVPIMGPSPSQMQVVDLPSGSPPPPSSAPSIKTMYIGPSYQYGYNPYVYVISSQPQVYYYRSQMPAYLPAPQHWGEPAPAIPNHPAVQRQSANRKSRSPPRTHPPGKKRARGRRREH